MYFWFNLKETGTSESELGMDTILREIKSWLNLQIY
jgi:hypothetical protein